MPEKGSTAAGGQSATPISDEQVARIAAALSPYQQDYMKTGRGRPHGLVARGLLAYRWGMNSSMGYKITQLGLAVRSHLLNTNGAV